MDPRINPYSPGAGRKPAALAGREKQMEAWDIALARVASGRDAQSFVLYGLRGVGKTVLLSHFASQARAQGWTVIQAEARKGMTLRQAMDESLHGLLMDMARPGVGKRILKAVKTALSFKASYDSSGVWSFGLDLKGTDGGGADTGSLETDLGRLLMDFAAVAEERESGVAVLIDEAQDLSKEELTALCAVIHGANQRQDRLLVGLAGLPNLPRQLSEAKSYSERLFTFHQIEVLTDDEARFALVDPAAAESVEWTQDALTRIITEAKGYPYFLQEYGQDIWNAAEQSPITIADARVGIAQGDLALDIGFFRIRWERASKTERAFLRAMAEDRNGPSAMGDIAARLKKKPSGLGPARKNLIEKGLVYSPQHGMIAFTVPAMADFIARQEDM